MSSLPDRFAPRSPLDVLKLVRSHPLAWVVSTASPGAHSTLLPLLPVLDAEQRITGFVGHFARSNAQLAQFRAAPQALLLFTGPQGYISPSWIDNRTWAPTWNYASAQFLVDLQFFEDPGLIQAHLSELVGVMEQGRPKAWKIEELGARYAGLSRGIVGFNATVREGSARFKLGQDERDEVLKNILDALEGSSGSVQLSDWMSHFNEHRRTNDGTHSG